MLFYCDIKNYKPTLSISYMIFASNSGIRGLLIFEYKLESLQSRRLKRMNQLDFLFVFYFFKVFVIAIVT